MDVMQVCAADVCGDAGACYEVGDGAVRGEARRGEERRDEDRSTGRFVYIHAS